MAWSWPFRREELRVVLLGNVGSGKSASGNTLLGTSHFDCKLSACPVTQQCEAKTVNRERWRIRVVDTPGLTAEMVTDTTKEKLLQCLQLSAPGPHVFLLVIPLGRFTQEEKDTAQRAAQLFKEHFYTFTIILFTFKDNLKNSSINDYISTAGESLQQLKHKCGNRYHAFNNNNPTEDDQAEQLLRKMNSLVQDNFETFYTLDDRMREHRMRREREERMRRAFKPYEEPAETSSMHEPPNVSDLRIVMMGKTGVGKSSTGNTILGMEAFSVSCSAKSVTKDCMKVKGKVDGRKVTVIDTPGLFDTDLTESSIINRLVECIALSCPGPHVFLLVLSLNRFTAEENQTVKKLQSVFGEEAIKYTIILFTGGDRLKQTTIEEYLEEASDDLKQVLEKCGGHYHVFNNENVKDQSQVIGLMDKIKKMVFDNKGGFYTNEMYENVERAIQEREEELRNEMDETVERAVKNREEELRNEMNDLVEEHKKELDEVKQKHMEELRERAVQDIKKKKFHQFRKFAEPCKQQ